MIEKDRICPVTGLPIIQKPEWENVQFGKEYKITFSLIGNNILLLQISGYASLEDVKKALAFSENIAIEMIPINENYILIEDLAKSTNISREARKYFINHLTHRKRILGLIFYNTSSLLKFNINLGQKLNLLKFNRSFIIK